MDTMNRGTTIPGQNCFYYYFSFMNCLSVPYITDEQKKDCDEDYDENDMRVKPKDGKKKDDGDEEKRCV